MDSTITIPNRMQLLIEWAQKEMKKHAKVERKQPWVEEEIQLLDKEEYLEAYHASEMKMGKSKSLLISRKRKSFYVSLL